jgi:hypothetical protein
MTSDHDGHIRTSSPPILQVPLLVQMQKAFAAEEPRESHESHETPGTVLETLGEKKKIPINYFCHGKMTEDHIHGVCFSNRTMSPSEKVHLLPQYLRILYEERRRMEWVSDKLKRIIWIYARGEKIYKHGEMGSLVEQFRDIQVAWKSSGTDTMYNKLLHAFIGQFDMTPHYFYELSREYMDLPDVWWEYDETKLVSVRNNKRDSSLKTVVTTERVQLIVRMNHYGAIHNKRLTVTLPKSIRENKGKWVRRLKGIPLPPLVRIETIAVGLAAQKVSAKVIDRKLVKLLIASD